MKGFFYVALLLGILKEIAGSSLKHQTDSDEKLATLFDMVQKVFQKLLECMAWSFRTHPEEGLRVLMSSSQDGAARWPVLPEDTSA